MLGQDVTYASDGEVFLNVSYIENLAPTGNYEPQTIILLRNEFLKCNKVVRRARLGTKFYSMRSPNLPRSIANDEEVKQFMMLKGIEPIDFGALSLRDQLRLASGAELIIGPHGANLANSFMMEANGILFELRCAGDAHNNCYFALASAASLRYAYSIHEVDQEGRITVDIGRLASDYERALVSTRQ